jgi:hypothetical protein
MAKNAWLLPCALILLAGPLAAQASLTYRERTGDSEITTRIEQERLPRGFVIRSYMSDGDYHEVEYGDSETTVRYRVASPGKSTDYSAARAGSFIVVQGVVAGRAVSLKLRIDDRPWYQTLEVSLSRQALAGSAQPLVFWIVHPWEARAYLMEAKVEPEQMVPVAGEHVRAPPVRVSPSGILGLFWSTLYWYRLSDGVFVRYEGVRGLLGTPRTVVELITEQ